VGLFFVL